MYFVYIIYQLNYQYIIIIIKIINYIFNLKKVIFFILNYDFRNNKKMDAFLSWIIIINSRNRNITRG